MATRRKRGRIVVNIDNNNRNIGGIEENTMAMLDTFGDQHSSKDNRYLIDDRLAFLEAVRAASFFPENGSAPTDKMHEAIFDILKNDNTLDLIVASYQLLDELDKRFPRVYLTEEENSEPSSDSFELIVVEEAWSPFYLGMEAGCLEDTAKKDSGGLTDALAFHSLVEAVGEVANHKETEALGTKCFRDVLLLQYLVKVMDQDLLPRNRAFGENMNWDILRGSLLNLLLSSRKISYKGLIKDCLSILCELSHGEHESHYDSSSAGSTSSEFRKISETAAALAFADVEKSTCAALKRFLLMIMELDSSRNVADVQGRTSRADGVRTPAEEIILDELTYNKDLLAPFLQVFDEQNLKLKFIVRYFKKYISKASVRTRNSNSSADIASFGGVLKCLLNSSSAKNIFKKIGADVVQLLLAHGFQAYLSLSLQHSSKGISYDNEDGTDSSLSEICKNTISAFTYLREVGREEITSFGKEALFTAATILSTKV